MPRERVLALPGQHRCRWLAHDAPKFHADLETEDSVSWHRLVARNDLTQIENYIGCWIWGEERGAEPWRQE